MVDVGRGGGVLVSRFRLRGRDLQRRTYSASPVNRVGLSGVQAGESGVRSRGSLSSEMMTAAQYAPLLKTSVWV